MTKRCKASVGYLSDTHGHLAKAPAMAAQIVPVRAFRSERPRPRHIYFSR